jgi:hypothetical protein
LSRPICCCSVNPFSCTTSVSRILRFSRRWLRRMLSSGIWHRVDILLVYNYLLTLVHRSWISYTLKMEAIRSSDTSVNKIVTSQKTAFFITTFCYKIGVSFIVTMIIVFS